MCAGMLTPVLKPPSRQLGPFWLRSTIYLIKKKDKMHNLLGLILRCSFAYLSIRLIFWVSLLKNKIRSKGPMLY